MGIDQTLASISTPDRVGTSLGTLEFTEGAAQRADPREAPRPFDFLHGVNVYLDAFATVSTAVLRQGFHSVGAEDNPILIFSS
jgi:hypothetical protein